jgi:hypothetical protein
LANVSGADGDVVYIYNSTAANIKKRETTLAAGDTLSSLSPEGWE